MCEHAGYQSGEGRYDRDQEVMRFVLVCDECASETREVAQQPYRPEPVLEIAQRP